MILFLVKPSEGASVCAVVTGRNREDACRQAHRFLGGRPDHFIVEPLTKPGMTVYFGPTMTDLGAMRGRL